MKAKLVTVSLTVRVIVADSDSEDDIVETAKKPLREKLFSDLYENVTEIIDDAEMPYGSNPEDNE